MRKNQRHRRNNRRETAIINLNKALEVAEEEKDTKKVKSLKKIIDNTINNMK